jgi:hypothetical protein
VPNFEPGLARTKGSYTALHNKVKLYYCTAKISSNSVDCLNNL